MIPGRPRFTLRSWFTVLAGLTGSTVLAGLTGSTVLAGLTGFAVLTVTPMIPGRPRFTLRSWFTVLAGLTGFAVLETRRPVFKRQDTQVELGNAPIEVGQGRGNAQIDLAFVPAGDCTQFPGQQVKRSV
jgi:hypothetical protein